MGTTMTTKGQVTVPKRIRDAMGLAPGSRVDFQLLQDGRIALVKEGTPPPAFNFDQLIGSAGPGLTTDEVMAMTRGDD